MINKLKAALLILLTALSCTLCTGCEADINQPDTVKPDNSQSAATSGTQAEIPDDTQVETPDVTPAETDKQPGESEQPGSEPEVPVTEPEAPSTEPEAPAPGQEEPSEETAARTDLPRDTYGLPMPVVALSEDDASKCLALTEKLDDSYFTDAFFLGDSVTLGLKNYTTKKRKNDSSFLSNAGFIAIGSYGVYEALRTPSDDTIHSLYNGVQTQPQDILAAEGAKSVFICLGLNDVGLFSMEEHLQHYATLILRIQTACPGIRTVILSTTPLTVEGEKKHLYNYKIDTYNSAVITLAEKYNCYYCDITSVLKDGEGYLADDLSSDNYCHLQPEAYDLIIDYIETHATPDAAPGSVSETRGTVIESPAEAEGYEGKMGEE